MKQFFSDFKAFALKGNILDLAVGVVIGGAFNAIIGSLVNHIIMPLISVLFNSGEMSTWGVVLKSGTVETQVVLQYGLFLQSVLNFLIIAFSVFMALRIIMKFKKTTDEKEVPKKKEDIALLEEIRDALLAQKK